MKKPKVINGYIVGSLPPKGYVDWHEWAAAQLAGGLEQVRCPDCGLYLFPQEKSEHKCMPNNAGSEPGAFCLCKVQNWENGNYLCYVCGLPKTPAPNKESVNAS